MQHPSVAEVITQVR